MSPEPHNPVEVFYSYAHEDEKLRDELKKHLSNLKRQGVITDWYDRDISAGTEWNDEIEKHLNSAKVILLLISPDFMDSDYIHQVEVKRAMERHEAGEARVIPVILRPVDWQGAPFSKLQSLPTDIRPVTLWSNQDEAFVDVTSGIRTALQELSDVSVGLPAGLDIPSPPKVGFVSRKDRDNHDLIERVRSEVSPGRNQLVVLWGAGGVGKTAIASEAVRGLIEPFARRIAWVSADGLETFSLSTLLDGITSQLGHSDLRKLPLDLKKEQVRHLVRMAPTLIVLDNFETIDLDERIHCVHWLGKPAPCSALITTRDVIEEARNIPIEAMYPEEANDLVEQLIAQTHEAKAFAKLDRDRLIRVSEANPLVLQWIVGQIDLAQDPDEVLDDLQHGEGKAADRVFNRSFELEQLNHGGRAVLLALSLFAPSATRKAVAEVSGLGKDSDRKKFRDAIRSLSGLWLIRTTDENKRLAVEGLTRQLTKARMDTDPRGKTFRGRFVSRFLNYAQTHARATKEDYDALEMERDNLLTATDLAFVQNDRRSILKLAYAIAMPIRGMLAVRGFWEEALRICEQALKTARDSLLELEIAHWSHNVALMYGAMGEPGRSRSLLTESLMLSKKLGNQDGMAITLNQLGSLAAAEGNLIEAQDFYNSSLELGEITENQKRVAYSLGQLGIVAYYLGNWIESRQHFNKTLGISQRLNDQFAIAITLRNLGMLAQMEGNFDESDRLHNESLKIEKKLGNRKGIADCLRLLGMLFQDNDQPAEARQFYEDSLYISKKLGDLKGVSLCLTQLGSLNFASAEYDAAERSLQASLDILRKLGDNLDKAECLENLGKLAVAQGRLASANDLLHEALAVAEAIGIRFRIASVKHSLGLLFEKKGDKTRAVQSVREAWAIFEKLCSPKAEDARRDLERIESRSSEVP
jgi:tetratricopeptide (TPR) repeat protein